VTVFCWFRYSSESSLETLKMKSYFILLRAMLLNKFRPVKKTGMSPGTLTQYIVLGVVLLYFTGLATAALWWITPFFYALGAVTELTSMVLMGATALVVFFGVAMMISYVYFCTDTEFLAAMPIKPSVVFLARLTLVYLIEFVTTAIMLLPTLLTVGIMAECGPLFYVGMVVSMFLIPALPLLLASFLAVPLMYVVSFFKNRGAWASVALVIVFGSAMALMYYTISSLGNVGENFDDYVRPFQEALEKTAPYVYPVYLLSVFMNGGGLYGLGAGASAAVAVLLVFAITAVMVAVAMVIASFAYQRSVLTQTENVKKGKKGEYVESSVFKVFLKKEWCEIIRTPTVGFQCLLGAIISPILIIVTTFFGRSAASDVTIAETGGLDFAGIYAFVPFLLILILSCSINTIASSMISREGKNFYMMKTIPQEPMLMIRAKLALQMIVTYISLGLSWLICVIIYNYTIIPALFSLFAAAAFGYASMMFAGRFEIDNPKLEWSSPIEVIKNSKNATIPVLASIGIGMLLFIGMVVGFVLLDASAIGGAIFKELIIWGGAFVVCATLAVLSHLRMFRNIRAAFEKIES